MWKCDDFNWLEKKNSCCLPKLCCVSSNVGRWSCYRRVVDEVMNGVLQSILSVNRGLKQFLDVLEMAPNMTMLHYGFTYNSKVYAQVMYIYPTRKHCTKDFCKLLRIYSSK